jgi:hypothetical protein
MAKKRFFLTVDQSLTNLMLFVQVLFDNLHHLYNHHHHRSAPLSPPHISQLKQKYFLYNVLVTCLYEYLASISNMYQPVCKMKR